MSSNHEIAYLAHHPTTDELLDPAEEREMEEPRFDEGNLEKSIADEVRRQIAGENVTKAELDDEGEPRGPTMTRAELIQLCAQLESGCMEYVMISLFFLLHRSSDNSLSHWTNFSPSSADALRLNLASITLRRATSFFSQTSSSFLRN